MLQPPRAHSPTASRRAASAAEAHRLLDHNERRRRRTLRRAGAALLLLAASGLVVALTTTLLATALLLVAIVPGVLLLRAGLRHREHPVLRVLAREPGRIASVTVAYLDRADTEPRVVVKLSNHEHLRVATPLGREHALAAWIAGQVTAASTSALRP